MTSHSGDGSATVLERNYLSPRDASRLLSVEPQTLAAWEKCGAIQAIRTGGGHRRFLKSEILALRDGGKPNQKEKAICYCRCSSSIQKESLERQTERVTKYAKEKHSDKEILLFKEIGSGFSAERKQLWQMLDKILSGELDGSVLICSDRDRLSRFIVEIFEKICERHSIKVEYIEQEMADDDKTFSADLIACITYWTVRYSAKKSGKRQAKPLTPECIERGLQLIAEGHSVNIIHELLQKEGHTASRHTVRRYIFSKRKELAPIIPPSINSARKYRDECTEAGGDRDRLLVDVLWEDYQQWCERTKSTQITKRMFLRQFSDYQGCSHTNRENVQTSANAYIGLKIKGKPELTIVVKPQSRRNYSADNDSLEVLLKFSDGLRGKEISSKKLQLNYQSYCRDNGHTPLKRVDIFRHLDRLCLSKKINGHGFKYQF